MEGMRLKWDIKAKSKTKGEISIYGEVCSYKWDDTDVTANDFQKELKTLGGISELDIFINSPGGSVFEGQAIYSILKRHKAKKTVYVDGIAASIASLIAMAGDEIIIPSNGILMIHNPWTWGAGNSSDFRKKADELEKIREAMIPAYLNKAGDKLTEEKLIELLDAETWLTGTEAFEYGLCDSVGEEKQIAASIMLNCYRNIPEQFKASKKDSFREGILKECNDLEVQIKNDNKKFKI